MKSLIKTVPTRQIFDLDVIKKGQIYKIEDRSLEHDSNYIIEDVTETEMHVTALIRGKTFTLKPEHIGVIVKFVCEMELIEKKDEMINKLQKELEALKNKINVERLKILKENTLYDNEKYIETFYGENY